MPGIQRTETFLSLGEMPSKELSVELLDSDAGDDAGDPEPDRGPPASASAGP
jgi:hypothetical protein